MAIVNWDHLFEQAEKLAAPPAAGPPRQVDLRRAVSAAYYAMFHFTMTNVADQFVGKTLRSTRRYALAYRSVDHKTLRELCSDVQKTTPNKKLAPHVPAGGFSPAMQAFATAVLDLQERRHRADYDPGARFKTSDVTLSIATGRSAVRRFDRAKKDQRLIFVTLLAFPPR